MAKQSHSVKVEGRFNFSKPFAYDPCYSHCNRAVSHCKVCVFNNMPILKYIQFLWVEAMIQVFFPEYMQFSELNWIWFCLIKISQVVLKLTHYYVEDLKLVRRKWVIRMFLLPSYNLDCLVKIILFGVMLQFSWQARFQRHFLNCIYPFTLFSYCFFLKTTHSSSILNNFRFTFSRVVVDIKMLYIMFSLLSS